MLNTFSGGGSGPLTQTPNADGFSVAGGTVARTLTITGASVTLNQSLQTTDSPTFKGLTVTGGTVTVSTPLLDATQTWNAGAVVFTALKLNVTNTASAAASLLLDLQVAASSVLAVGKGGGITQVATFAATSGPTQVNNFAVTLTGTNTGTSSQVGTKFSSTVTLATRVSNYSYVAFNGTAINSSTAAQGPNLGLIAFSGTAAEGTTDGVPLTAFLAAVLVNTNSSTVTDAKFYTNSAFTAGGTNRFITNLYGFFYNPSTLRVTNEYGVYINSVNAATTLNYAIFTNAGLVQFGDQVAVIGSADRIQTITKAFSSQTASIHEWQDSSANILSRINKAGYFMTRKVAAPADGDLASSELAIWLDNTIGATKIMFKAKDSGGTVRTGNVALT